MNIKWEQTIRKIHNNSILANLRLSEKSEILQSRVSKPGISGRFPQAPKTAYFESAVITITMIGGVLILGLTPIIDRTVFTLFKQKIVAGADCDFAPFGHSKALADTRQELGRE